MGGLTNILWQQFEKQKGVDFVFKFADEQDNDNVLGEFGVHTIILASQSTVFDAMLTGEMKETSPLILKDISPDIFKKFVSVLYDQDTTVFSLEEAQSFYYLGAKYDFPKAILIAKNYMLDNIDFTNVTLIYECAQLFNDEDIEKANWDFLETFILKTINGLECLGGKKIQAKEENSFEITNTSEIADVLAALKMQIEEIRNQIDVKKKVGYSIGLIKSLIEQVQTIFRLIVPNKTISLVASLQEKNEFNAYGNSSFEKLHRLYNKNANCMLCERQHSLKFNSIENHKLVACTRFGIAPTYQKYHHDNLTSYNVEDIFNLHNALRNYYPA